MDEAMLKSGQFPNVAIMAGSDPKEVMREHGQTSTEHMDNGVSVHMCPNDTGAHSNVTQILSDTREKLEVDLNSLCLDCLGLGWNAANDLKKSIRKLLDRQAAITANETSHDNPYVGLVRGKLWERTEISDYYCGRCGWKVTDHDSYCPECGGALHKTPNKPNSQFDALKTAENAENAASKNEIHNFDDSREQLEADIRAWHRDTPFATKPSVQTLLGWLDRQKEITEREVKERVDFSLITQTANALFPDYQERIAELTAERDELREELRIEREAVEACEGCDKVDELTAERDRLQERNDRQGEIVDKLYAKVDELNANWRKANDGWAEANAEAERWRQKCDQLSRDLTAEHALVVQFEHDNEEIKADLKTANDTINTLRASVAGLKETVEKLGAQ